VKRRVEFIHIPVPKGPIQSFFESMRNWRKPAGTHLFLGLLQFNDDAGNRARTKAARHFVEDFGVGAECSFVRVPGILAGHRAAAELL
jgi:hypothetical protein